MKFPLLFVAGLSASLFCMTSLRAQPVAAAKRPPNVVFIAVDDLKPAIGAFGDPFAKTPNIDALAARSTTFLNAHCQQTVCGPSRASVLTGLRPDTTRVYDMKVKLRDLQPDVVTLPQHFKNNGYEVVGLGKLFDPRNTEGGNVMDRLSWSRPYITVKAPADETFGYLDPTNTDVIRAGIVKAKAAGITGWNQTSRYINHRPAFESADVGDDDYKDGVLAREASGLIGPLAANEKPFFLAVGFARPHLPFVAPKRYWDLYDRDSVPLAKFTSAPAGAPALAHQDYFEIRSGYTSAPKKGPIDEALQRSFVHGYYACVSYIDAQVGRVIAAVDASGEADNTIIVLWSDHGFHLGDHGMWAKHTNYEQATRVTLLVSAASLSGIGPNVVRGPVELLDIFPTLCDLAALTPPSTLQGVSLTATMKNPSQSAKRFAVSQFPRSTADGERMGYALRDERFRYVQWRKWSGYAPAGDVVAEELYDLQDDPEEKRNQIAETSASGLEPFRDFANHIVSGFANTNRQTK